ncbi:MAG: PKD domain-containing protein, partial [Salibacteraceae bacterium]
MNKTILSLITFLFLCLTTQGQKHNLKGKEFWFGFMANISSLTKSVVAITSDNGATGVVEIPQSGWSTSFTVPANGSIEMVLPSNITQASSTGTFPFGIKITSSDYVSVYTLNRDGGSEDAVQIKPLAALGYEYYVATWFEPVPRDDLAEYIIVGTANNTSIQITSPAGGISTINLDAGELHQVQSSSELTGTHIEVICNSAGKMHPVAVFSGARSTEVGAIPARDHLVSQMTPVETWGTSFNLVPLPYNNDYFVNIIASENGTQVSFNGNNINLNAGAYYRGNLIGLGYISSNKPISVQVFTRGFRFITGHLPGVTDDGDPLMINVSPDDQGVTDVRFYGFDHPFLSFVKPQKVQVVTEASNTNNITFNGTPVTGWTTNPFNPFYSYATVVIPPGNTDHVLSSSGAPFVAVYSGLFDASGYGYTIGFNYTALAPGFEIGYLQDTLNYQDFTDTICSCEPVYFEGNYPNGSVGYLWDFGNGTTQTGNPITHTFTNGNFDIKLYITSPSGCIIDSLTKTNLMVENCDIAMSPATTICPGDSVTLTSLSGNQFLWSTGENTTSITVAPQQTTTYTLAVNGGSLAICGSITVYVHPQNANMDDTVTICSNTEYLIDPGLPGYYLWSTNEIRPSITVSQSGTYWVEITDTNNCFFTDTLLLVTQDPTNWWLEDPYYLCDNSSIQVIPQGTFTGSENYQWSTLDTSFAITVTDGGAYWLKIDDGICVTSDT